jgi:hypothetical protein
MAWLCSGGVGGDGRGGVSPDKPQSLGMSVPASSDGSCSAEHVAHGLSAEGLDIDSPPGHGLRPYCMRDSPRRSQDQDARVQAADAGVHEPAPHLPG